ncbi:MAG TPA: FlgD immunoglobulin-like domain containing protein [Candidatus Limnocylindrales bacterium]|nr:FlgD immunoglobulin-like domain containing protein [Candidatus Limnocylindrales bacterium]
MKRLLSLVAVATLVASMLPSTGVAGFRGAFDPIGRTDIPAADGVTYGNGLANGQQTPALRSVPVGVANGVALMERWYAFTTRDQVFGFETSREIWQGFNRTQPTTLVSVIGNARSPMLKDPTGVVSYTDPAWSPNGRFLAYVLTDFQVTSSAIVVQEYTASTNMTVSITPVGSPIVVVAATAGVRNRHPDWSPDGNSLAYDSDKSGTSIDLYTVQVFPTVGSPVQHTFVNNRAEQNPAWNPDGVRICYDTNRFGPNVIEVVDTSTNAVSLAEANFASVSHSNPQWSSDGNSIYYDAPGAEDPQQNQNIWKLDLATQAKCEIQLDGAGDINVSASKYTNHTNDGIPYNNIFFESQAAGFGLIIWRANPIQRCEAPLPMAVSITPATLNMDGGGGGTTVGAQLSFPPETNAAGYVMSVLNQPPREGVRFRTSIAASPTMFGNMPANFDPHTGIAQISGGNGANGSEQITAYFSRRAVQARLTALGLVNQTVPVRVDAYSNIVGRTFRGFGLLRANTTSLAGSMVKLEQNAPNPFNPVTKIRFATSKAGNVSLRVYNVRGEMVKTIASGHFEQGMHEATWNGRNQAGQTVSSGVYYAKVSSEHGNSDVIKMVVAK